MVDITEQEQAAIAAAVKPVAEIMGEIGWSTRFQDLTEAADRFDPHPLGTGAPDG